MKFHLDGGVLIRTTPDRIYQSLNNLEFMVTAIPDLQSYKIVDADHFEAKIKIGISLVRGTVDMKFFLTDKVEGQRAKLVGDGAGAGSNLHIESTFELSSAQDGTMMKWYSDAELGGVISGIGGSMLKGQSEKMISQIFQNIKSKLEK